MSTSHVSGPLDSVGGYQVNGTEVINSSAQIANTQTALTITTATIATSNVTTQTVAGAQQLSLANVTAGTTQTQAGATAVVTDIAYVTTSNASDGLRLPALAASMIGRTIRIINASANAGVLYGTGTTSTNTINGTAGATGVAYAASKMITCVAVSATAWVTTLSN